MYSCVVITNGVFRKDYRNRNKKQLVPAVVSFAKKGTGTETGLVGPRGRWRTNFAVSAAKKKLRCRSASESVFAVILDQNFQGFISSNNVFSDAEVLEIGQN